MNKQEFAKGIKILELTYGQKFDTEKIDFWFRQLEDLSADKFYENIRKIVKTSKYMPNIAQIRNEDKEMPINLSNINLNSSYWYINLRELCDEKGITYYDIKTGKPLEPYKI